MSEMEEKPQDMDQKLQGMIEEMEKAIQLLPEDQREWKGPELKFMRDIIMDPKYLALKEAEQAKSQTVKEPKKIAEPKPKAKHLKIEIAPTTEEAQKTIDMGATLEKIKSDLPAEIPSIQDQAADVTELVSELEEAKSEVGHVDASQVMFVEKAEAKVEKPGKERKPKSSMELVLELEKATTGEQSEISPEKLEALEVVKQPVLVSLDEEPSLEKIKDMDEIEEWTDEEEEFVHLPAEYHKEIFLPEEKLLENVRKLVDELKKQDLTEEELMETSGLTAMELYNVLEWLKENELLLVTKKNYQIRYIFPETSVERWNEVMLPHGEDFLVDTPEYYQEYDEKEILAEGTSFCPFCKKIVEEREIKLILKGYNPECPACNHVLGKKDIGL